MSRNECEYGYETSEQTVYFQSTGFLFKMSKNSKPSAWPAAQVKYVQTMDLAKAAYQSSAPGGLIHAVALSSIGTRNLQTAKKRNIHMREQQQREVLDLRQIMESYHDEQRRNTIVHVPVDLAPATNAVSGAAAQQAKTTDQKDDSSSQEKPGRKMSSEPTG